MWTAKYSEQELIANASKGDLDAFNQLVLEHQDSAYQYALALAKDPDMADDITQESFIKAFQNISRFRNGSFRGWVLKIVANTIRDHWRRTKRHPTLALVPEGVDGEELGTPAWMVDPANSVEDTVQGKENCHYLKQTLDELPSIYREVIVLIDAHELDYIEVGQILQVPIGTVKSRLARARIQLREKLTGDSSYSWRGNGTLLLASCI